MQRAIGLASSISQKLLQRSETTACTCRKNLLKAVGEGFGCTAKRWEGAGAEGRELVQHVKRLDFTTKQVWWGTRQAITVVFCFFVGEIIGRGSILGYDV